MTQNADKVAEPLWGFDDPDNPQPRVWPECRTCRTPFVYKRFLSFGTGHYVWAWARNCKHKGDAALAPTDGSGI